MGLSNHTNEEKNTMQQQPIDLDRLEADALRGMGASSEDTLRMVQLLLQARELIQEKLECRSITIDITMLSRNLYIPRYTLLYLLSLFAVDFVVHGITGSVPITILAVIAAACVLNNPFSRTSLLIEANNELLLEQFMAANPHLRAC